MAKRKISRWSAAYKAFRAQPRQGSGILWFGGGQEADIARAVKDGTDSSAVVAPLRWLQRNVVEAPVRIRQISGDELTPVSPDNRLVKLLATPNEYYTWSTMLRAVVGDYVLDGNGYMLAALNQLGQPVELWWAPKHMVTPTRLEDSDNLVDFYEYNTGDGQPARIQPIGKDRSNVSGLADGWAMIHYRDGIDPNDTAKGISGFHSLLREVYTDMEAAAFTSSLLGNRGVPGLVVSPKDDGGALQPIDDEDVRETKAKFEQATTGGNRGRTIVMTAPTTIQTIGFNPTELDLTRLRRIPEERITAVLGVPAVVCGLGAGLERSTFSNMAEAKESAYEDTVLPMQRDLADTIQLQLLPQFEQNPENFQVDFDTTQVRALQEDADKRAARLVQLVNGGIVTVAEGREGMGLPVRDEHRVYRVPLNLVEVPEGQTMDDALGGQQDAQQPVTAATRVEPSAKGMRPLPARARVRYVVTQERAAARYASRFARRLEKFFADLAAEAAAAWRELDPPEQVVIGEKSLSDEARAAAAAEELSRQQIELANRVLDRLQIQKWEERLAREYDAMLESIADNTISTTQSLLPGIQLNVPDAVREQILRQGGTRYKLVNLEEQTTAAIREAIADGTAEGLGVDAIERMIRDAVEGGGTGRNVSARAMRIARTETLHAQRLSSIATLDGSGAFATVIAFDNRIGHDDADCIERDQTVMTMDEAYSVLEDEHPNGTLNFAPYEVNEEGLG